MVFCLGPQSSMGYKLAPLVPTSDVDTRGLGLEIGQLLLHELNLAQRAVLPLNLRRIPCELGALVSG